ncbi:MAG TPA: sugar ABC transporter permease [Candidatus Limnocylindria bacterium]|nr:sugar ABC transporter permease [Candidatus Limnocylindria bacterium]
MADAENARERETTFSRFLLPVLGVLGIVIILVGVRLLADPRAGQNILASIYDLIGNSEGAEALRRGLGDVLLAKIVLAVVALAIGVGGVWMLYSGVSALVGLLNPGLQQRIIPWVFIVPALLLVGIYLVYPTIATILASFTDGTGGDFLRHYRDITAGPFLLIFRNNLIWLIVGTLGSVGLGLLIAGLVDRVRREALAKTFIFLPLAISLVGASVIWRFVYQWRPEGQPQYGLLNAVWTAFGGDPVPWTSTPPGNTFALIVIMIWLQTGFAMVVLSAAIKGVSVEVIEAARLDGANERQTFFQVIVPIIKGSIITVATTIAIVVLKIFDIVYVMTGGRNETDVVANRMFLEMFQFFNDGRAAALATVLFLAVLPIMIINVRNLRRQGIGA